MRADISADAVGVLLRPTVLDSLPTGPLVGVGRIVNPTMTQWCAPIFCWCRVSLRPTVSDHRRSGSL